MSRMIFTLALLSAIGAVPLPGHAQSPLTLKSVSVDLPDRGRDVGDPQPAVEALDQLAVVHLEGEVRQRKCPERLHHHPHHLDVVVERELVLADDVDVGLGELPVATLLRTLAPPGRLDLVATEREVQAD